MLKVAFVDELVFDFGIMNHVSSLIFIQPCDPQGQWRLNICGVPYLTS